MQSINRRSFLIRTASTIACAISGEALGGPPDTSAAREQAKVGRRSGAKSNTVRLFLAGDVMTGRGIDQIMPSRCDPQLYERHAKSAMYYVALAEKVSGPIPRVVAPNYIWGDVLAELERAKPDARIVNLETAVTTSDDVWLGKNAHYRMHPANVACLRAAKIDCCVLANNHVLDWAYTGLRETVATLRGAGIRTSGAGDSMSEAARPAILNLRTGGRVLLFAYGSPSSGVPRGWIATPFTGGINGLEESDPAAVEKVASAVRELRRPGDIVVSSIHWGTNWGYEVSRGQRRLAHELIDEAGVDVVYGHSSHHPRPIEVYRGKLILFGCGDLLNDYEGIGSHKTYRPELGLMYLPEVDAKSGQLQRLVMVPTRVWRFRVNRASRDECEWMASTLKTAVKAFGTRVSCTRERELELAWS